MEMFLGTMEPPVLWRLGIAPEELELLCCGCWSDGSGCILGEGLREPRNPAADVVGICSSGMGNATDASGRFKAVGALMTSLPLD